VADLLVIEIDARHGIVGARIFGLFLNTERLEILIKIHHPITLGVAYRVGEDRGPFGKLGCLAEFGGQTVTIENIITQDHTGRLVVNEVPANDEGFRQTAGLGLFGIRKLEPPLLTTAQQAAKTGQVFGGTDDQNFTNVCQHQHRQRVINHGLVVDRQHLLADRQGDGVKAGAFAAGQNNAFHWRPPRLP